MAGARKIWCACCRHTAERIGRTLYVFIWGNPPFRVDILTRISGVTFEDAWSRRTVHTVNDATGLTSPFISVADLIANKLEAGRDPGRLQDLADAQALRRAAETQTDGPRENNQPTPAPTNTRPRGRGW